ncbi:MAG: hypothetical protein ACXVB0_19085 [Mucilaginibacter sp.]
MKTNYLKGSMLIIAVLALSTAAKAQDSAKKTAYFDRNNNYDIVDNKTPGKVRERIQTNWKGKTYQMELLNNKMTALSVEGEKIPAAKWGDYSAVIAGIKEQIRKDKIQARKDQAQANRDQVQAARDQIQAKRDQEQAERDQVQAKKEQERAGLDQEQAKKDQEQAARDQVQAKKDQEQAGRDQEQAKKDQEQAAKDQVQAKKDQEQAEEDQRQMKMMISDLVSDHIVSNAKALHDLTLDADGITVNGKKQPDDVFKKYQEKYSRFAKGNFSYGENGQSQHHGIHMHLDSNR